MSVVVKIPTQLRAAAGGESEAEVEGTTVQEVLDGLFDRFGELRDRISDDDGGLRRFVNVYVAGEDIRLEVGPPQALASTAGLIDDEATALDMLLARCSAVALGRSESTPPMRTPFARR